MVLGDVEETITVVDINEETYEEVIRVRWLCEHCTDSASYFLAFSPHTFSNNEYFSARYELPHLTHFTFISLQTVKRNSEMLFVRGDGVILVR